MAKKDLLQLPFEGILKYFRVSLPRRFISEDEQNNFMNVVMSYKVSIMFGYTGYKMCTSVLLNCCNADIFNLFDSIPGTCDCLSIIAARLHGVSCME